MTDRLTSGQNRPSLRPLRIAPDANVFAERAWVNRLIEEARAGHIRLYWSPKTLEEVGRVRLWIWLKKAFRDQPLPRGSSRWKALWSRYSEEAHQWFARVSPFCEVVEDREPHETAWMSPLPDPNDAWLWNTARRSRADLVVTANLKDAPPPDAEGSRHYETVAYIHPRSLMIVLDIWRGILTTGEVPATILDRTHAADGAQTAGDMGAVAAQLRAILERVADESVQA